MRLLALERERGLGGSSGFTIRLDIKQSEYAHDVMADILVFQNNETAAMLFY